MNIQSSITVIISGIVAFALALFIIQFLAKEVRKKAIVENALKPSFGIWFGSLLLSITLLLSKAMSVLKDATDVLVTFPKEGMYFEIFKSGSIFIGLAFLWFLVSFYIIKIFCRLIFSNSIDEVEMEQDNISYFIIKGIMIIVFVLCLLPAFESLSRSFIVTVSTPIYH